MSVDADRRLVPVSSLPPSSRALFPFASFNRMQSECFDEAYGSDRSMVVSAPTGTAGIENAETNTSSRINKSHIILRRVSGITMYHARGGRSLSSISRTSSYTSSSSFSEYSFPILFLCACRLATIAPFPDASAFSSLADDGVYPAAFLPAEKLVGRDGSVCVRRPASGAGAPPEKLVGREAPPPPVAALERWCCSTASSVGGMVAPAPAAPYGSCRGAGGGAGSTECAAESARFCALVVTISQV